eukprot:Opistho-2@35241
MSAPGTPSGGSSLFGGLQLKTTPNASTGVRGEDRRLSTPTSSTSSAFPFIRHESASASTASPASAPTPSPRSSVFSFISGNVTQDGLSNVTTTSGSTKMKALDASVSGGYANGVAEDDTLAAASAANPAKGIHFFGLPSGVAVVKKKVKSKRLVRPGHDRDDSETDGLCGGALTQDDPAHTIADDANNDCPSQVPRAHVTDYERLDTLLSPGSRPGGSGPDQSSAAPEVGAPSRHTALAESPGLSGSPLPAPGERGDGDGVNNSISASRGASSLASSAGSLLEPNVPAAIARTSDKGECETLQEPPGDECTTGCPRDSFGEALGLRDAGIAGGRGVCAKPAPDVAVVIPFALSENTRKEHFDNSPTTTLRFGGDVGAAVSNDGLESLVAAADGRVVLTARAREVAARGAQTVASGVLARERRLAELFLTLGECRREQDECVAREDYDKADALASQLRDVQEEIVSSFGSLSESSVAVGDELRAAVEAEARAAEIELDAIKERTRLLESLRRERAASLDALQRRASIRLAERKKRITADKERVARELAHHELDLSHAVSSLQRMRAEVDEGTAVQKSELSRLERERSRVAAEIDALMIRLDALRSAQRAIDASIAKERSSMDEVSRSFGGEHARLEAEKLRLSTLRDSCAKKLDALGAEEMALERSPEGLAAEIALEEQAIRAIDEQVLADRRKLADVSGGKAEIAEWLSRCAAGQSALAALAAGLGSDSDELKSLRDEVNAESADVAGLTAVLIRQQEEASSTRKIIADSSTRLPELEEEKRLAVAGYNFKEAGRVAALIKELSSVNTDALARIAHLEAELARTRTLLDNAKEQAERDRLRLYEMERSHDISELDRWKAVFLDLVDRLQRVRLKQSQSAGGRSDMKSVLLYEIDACRFRIMGLCAKHDVEPDIDLDADKCVDVSVVASGPRSTEIQEELVPDPTDGEVNDCARSSPILPMPSDAAITNEKIAFLQMRLQTAIEAEDYELAASLHETLQTMKGGRE